MKYSKFIAMRKNNIAEYQTALLISFSKEKNKIRDLHFRKFCLKRNFIYKKLPSGKVKLSEIIHHLVGSWKHELIVWLMNTLYSQVHQADVEPLESAILDKTTCERRDRI